MKAIIQTTFILSFVFCTLLNARVSVAADDEALAIAKERKARDTGWHASEAEVSMLLKNAQGQEATRELSIKSLEVTNDGDKALTVFNSPRDVAGTAFLSFSHIATADEQWIYLPALKRVKRISSKNKSGPFVGSEFAFEDMTSYEVEKFSYTLLGEDNVNGEDCYVLKQTPVYEFSGYSFQKVWIDKAHFRVQKIEFYDKKEALLKTLVAKEYTLYEGKFWRPLKTEVKNAQTGKATYLITQSITFDTDLTSKDFNKNSLKRAR